VLSNLFFALGMLWLFALPALLSAKVHKNIAAPVITTDVTTIVGLSSRYGTLNGSISTFFKVSGTDIVGGILITAPPGFEISVVGSAYANSVVVGSSGTVAPTIVNVRLKLTAPAGDYSGNFVLSSGGKSVSLPVLKSTVSKADLTIAGGNRIKVYGETWTDTEGGKVFASDGLANGESIGVVSIHYGQGAAATDSAQRYTGSIIAYGAAGGTFDPSNYNIKYLPSDIFVVPAKLTLVADDQTKYSGEANPVLTYHGVGFVNNEDLKVISIKPTIKTSATATSPAGKYGITLSGLAYAGNYNITFTDGTLTIDSERPPAISTAGTPTTLNTAYGSASASTTFSVSGDRIKDGGILVTAPAGFEVSTDNVTFSPTLKVGGAGTVNSTNVYLRLKADANVGTHSGNVVLSSGVASVNVPVTPSEVTIVELTIIANITKPYGTALTDGPVATGFTATGLKNGETIGAVTLTYSAGTAATDGLKTYPGSVTSSAATGGTFTVANYNITYQFGDLVVGPAPLTITAENKTRFFKDPDPVFTLKYSGFVNNETETVLTSQPIISTTATIASPIGKYPITISGAVAANYTISYVPGELTITSKAVLVANAFTPNGDGVNDTWDIQNITQYPHCTVEVFNRYGQKLFYSTGYPIAWTGTKNGANLPEGTYYYIIKLDTGIKPLTGYLAIIR
jgi:gliding motility-associated-like protein